MTIPSYTPENTDIEKLLFDESLAVPVDGMEVVITNIASLVSKALKHINGRAAAYVLASVAETGGFNVLVEYEREKDGRKIFVIGSTTDFLSRVKSTVRPIFDANKDFNDPLYLFGAAVEEVLEKTYRVAEEDMKEDDLINVLNALKLTKARTEEHLKKLKGDVPAK